MKHDFYSRYDFVSCDTFTQQEAIAYLTFARSAVPKRLPHLSEVADPFARISLLSQSLNTPNKDYARAGRRTSPAGILNLYSKIGDFRLFLRERREWLKAIGVDHNPADLKYFPKGSWSIRFFFKLDRPYLSNDDRSYYVIDNPIKKEWVFKVPYMAPGQWKGALRSAMMQELVSGLFEDGSEEVFLQKRCQLWRIFGNEKDGSADFLNMALARYRKGEPDNEKGCGDWNERLRDEARKIDEEFSAILKKKGMQRQGIEGFRGCLHFYPTFFDRIDLEVINPHNRETGAGKQPIYFECAPEGTEGEFNLLYVPFGPVTTKECLDDLKAVSMGIGAMMTTYGFGAKTSSGFGRAMNKVRDGRLQIAGLKVPEGSLEEMVANRPTSPGLPRYLQAPGQLHGDFCTADGGFVSEDEYKQRLKRQGKRYKKKDRQLYNKAKRWWDSQGKNLEKHMARQHEKCGEEKPLTPPVSKCRFSSLEQLENKASGMADLRKFRE